MTKKLRVRFGSSVGGGPLARLVPRLRELGVDAELVSLYSPERWRALMQRGSWSRGYARLAANVVFPLGFALRSVLEEPGTILVPTTNPPVLPIVTVLAGRLLGVPVVPLIYDLYPDAVEAAGLLREDSVASRLAAHLNRSWLAKASAVVFIGEAMRRHARARYGSNPREALLETGADTEELSGSREARTKVVSYVGNMGAMHDWETLATALPQLDAEFAAAGVRVVIAASGAGAERLAAATRHCASVEFRPPLGDEEWRALMGETAVSLVTLKREAVNTCVPSKAYSALAAGSALVVVAPKESDLAALVRDHRCGVTVEPGEVPALVSALRTLVIERKGLEECQVAARRAALAQFDMAALARRWREFLVAVPPPPSSPWYPHLKRGLDVGVAASALVAFAPILLGVAAAVRLTLGSPVLFRQERPGLHARTFPLLKFRTMRPPQPGEEGPDSDAARLTRLGRFLRATSLDELPSLINVLRGEMSLVGPRPLLVRYLPRYSAEQARRHEVPPGLTGWAQVNGRNALSWEDKFALDVWYVDHRSMLLDLRILFRTLQSVVLRQGISSEGHATMPEFMGSEVAS